MGQNDRFPPGALQPGDDLTPPRCIDHRGRPDQREIGCDAHQDIGVIDWVAGLVSSVKGDRLEIELRAEPLERNRVRPVGTRDVGGPLDVIEDHRTSAFQIEAVVLETGVVNHFLDPVVALEHLDDIVTPLSAETAFIG